MSNIQVMSQKLNNQYDTYSIILKRRSTFKCTIDFKSCSAMISVFALQAEGIGVESHCGQEFLFCNSHPTRDPRRSSKPMRNK